MCIRDRSRLSGNIDQDILRSITRVIKKHNQILPDMRKKIIDIMIKYKDLTSSSWNAMFKEINDLEDGCIFFRYSIIKMIKNEHRLDIPDVVKWVININEGQADEHLLHYKRVYP